MIPYVFMGIFHIQYLHRTRRFSPIQTIKPRAGLRPTETSRKLQKHAIKKAASQPLSALYNTNANIKKHQSNHK